MTSLDFTTATIRRLLGADIVTSSDVTVVSRLTSYRIQVALCTDRNSILPYPPVERVDIFAFLPFQPFDNAPLRPWFTPSGYTLHLID